MPDHYPALIRTATATCSQQATGTTIEFVTIRGCMYTVAVAEPKREIPAWHGYCSA